MQLNANHKIFVCHESLDLNRLNQVIQTSQGQSGAAVVFTGSVRGGHENASCKEKSLTGMTLEHYPGMTESQLALIVRKAQKKWHLTQVMIAHRVGFLMPGEAIVFVGVAGQHRQEAFLAAEFIMDFLKQDATFWKKEHYGDQSIWVLPKQSDNEALKRWESE